MSPKVLRAHSHREAFRLRAEHGGLEAVADRATPASTAIAVENIFSLLPLHANDTLMDVGSGDGQFLRRAAPQVLRCAALDVSCTAATELRTRLHEHPNIVYACAVSEQLPFKSGSFSVAVINAVMPVLGSYEEAGRTVAEISRVLVPGGQAYFGEIPTIDERTTEDSSVGLLRRGWIKIRREGLGGLVRRLRDLRRQPTLIIAPNTLLFWPQDAFVSLLHKHGFQVEHIATHRTIGGPTSRLNYLARRVVSQ